MRARRAPPARVRARPAGLWPALLWLVAILAVTFVVYLPSLGNGFLNWDDNFYVTDNPIVAHPTLRGLLTENVGGNFHPLTMASLALNYRMSGMDAGSYHWTNLLFHLANTALVFFFVRALSGGRLWTSVVTSLFFGIHPMHVESVAWISERKDVLYAFFYLIGLLTYLRYLDGRRWWLVATWLAFVLSVASKPAAVVLPLTLFLIDWFRRRPLAITMILEKVPFLAVSVAAGVLTFGAQKGVGAVHADIWSPLQKVLFASVGTVMYVAKLFVPIHLAAVYPLPATATSTAHYATGYYVAPFVVLAGLVATLVVGKRLRPVLFGVAFFFNNIILVLQLLSVGIALLAERYTYIPYIGLFFALAWWLDEPAGSPRARWNLGIAGVCLALVPLSLIQTWNRCHVFHDPLTFWNDTIDKYPGKIVDGYYNRANYLVEHGRPQEALQDYNRALDLNGGVARTWYNKGVLLAKMGQVDSALVSFDRSLALDPKNVDALNNRGAMRYKKGDLEGAIADFSRILELNPRYREAYMNRAVAHGDRKEYEQTVRDVQQGIALDPANPANEEEYGLMGQALQHLGRGREALAALDRAISGSPPNAPTLGLNYFYRSMAWASLGDREHALADVREAEKRGIQVDPKYVRSLRPG